MGADHQRRVIGYFTNWRTGKDGKDAYLVPDIPWDKVTHLNYAFAHVDGSNKLSVGPDGADNASTGMTWPGVAGAEMDPALPYKGHFNLLTKYKKKHPNVKTLVSVGGWAETGGYFGPDGKRVNSGGFYSMATNADGSVNQAGINTFADSAVDFIKKYGFNGVDIDYEYATTMKDAGNPLDHTLANGRREPGQGLRRPDEDAAREARPRGRRRRQALPADRRRPLLRLPAAGHGDVPDAEVPGLRQHHVLRPARRLERVRRAERLAVRRRQGRRTGAGERVLDLAVRRHRLPQHRLGLPLLPRLDATYRINIGLPYYTRGFKNVQGGTDGLWGRAATTDCPAGAGLTKCGDGAVGIDNLWHDKDSNGKESPAGSNPMWHAKNLEKGIVGDYLSDYGFPANTQLTGTYARKYDSTLVAPWLWNAQKKVFLSTEDEQSVKAKADYVVDKGIGGTMIWELA